MNIDHDAIKTLLSHLTEGLNVEVKSWIDPADPNGVAKIVKAALALRNRNGGYLVIGFDDKTLQPDVTYRPPDVRDTFHLDKIQALISRFAFELFEVGVTFPEYQGLEYPVIVVPPGVRVPVAAKRDLIDSAGKKLIDFGDVYFRTLSANGTPSTALAQPQDWAEILEICFENREADIGRFLRRHLGRDLASFLTAIGNAGAATVPAPPSLRDRAINLLNDGDRRFRAALDAHPEGKQVKASLGTWSVALVIDPARPDQVPDSNFLNIIAAANPQYTGWPPWMDSRNFRDTDSTPKVKEKAWETLIVSLQGWSRHVDFFRMDPSGDFYLGRILQDDVQEKIQPNMVLDPILVILRTAEVIAVGLAFAKALNWDMESTRLGFAFRWTHLSGRELYCWSNSIIPISATDRAHDAVAESFVEVPLITSPNAIGPYIAQAIRDLFVLFGGYMMPNDAIEHWVQRLVERKLP